MQSQVDWRRSTSQKKSFATELHLSAKCHKSKLEPRCSVIAFARKVAIRTQIYSSRGT